MALVVLGLLCGSKATTVTMRFTTLAMFIAALVSLACGQIISYTPSKGKGVSYSVNIPHGTDSAGSGPIYLQIKAPSDLRWVALGQGSRMRHGNMFIVYSAGSESTSNVTLSPRRATGPYEPFYSPDIKASLLEGSGVSNGTLTANIRCDNCMFLREGNTSIMGPHSQWIWAMREGSRAPMMSTNITHQLRKHSWHGIFSLDLTKAIGGSSERNPFLESESLSTIDYTSESQQEQTSDILLRKKRIAHGSLTALTFVLFFPNIGLVLYVFPSRRTVAWIHAPLQIFATLMALAGLGVGVSVSKDLHDVAGYHPIMGYITILGVALFQPILGIAQHLRFRKSGQKTWYGVAHRYVGRFFCVLGVVNGGLGFHYACSRTPRVPVVSRRLYAFIVAGQAIVYVFVVWWKRSKDAKSRAKLSSDSESQMVKDREGDGDSNSSSSSSDSASVITTTKHSEKVGTKTWSS